MVFAVTRRGVGYGLATPTLLVVVAGCGLFGGSSSPTPVASGVISSPRASAAQATSGVSGTPSTKSSTNPSAGASVAPSTVPSLRPKPGASNLPCNAEGLVLHLSQASGAVHTYLAKPSASGATVVALKTPTTRATGAKAATYTAGQLTTGMAVASGCATTAALNSVAKQTATYLTALSKKLTSNTATAANVSAAEALIADVNAQAGRAGLKIVDRVVAPNLLK